MQSPKEDTAFPRETEEAEEGRERRKGVPTPGGGRAGTWRNPPVAGTAGGQAARKTPLTPRLGTLGLREPAWSSPRPGETRLPAETLRVAGHRPSRRRPFRLARLPPASTARQPRAAAPDAQSSSEVAPGHPRGGFTRPGDSGVRAEKRT